MNIGSSSTKRKCRGYTEKFGMEKCNSVRNPIVLGQMLSKEGA